MEEVAKRDPVFSAPEKVEDPKPIRPEVHVFVFPRLREAMTSPVVGEIVRVESVFETEVTTPDAPASVPH